MRICLLRNKAVAKFRIKASSKIKQVIRLHLLYNCITFVNAFLPADNDEIEK
jgi:hypothetical protein